MKKVNGRSGNGAKRGPKEERLKIHGRWQDAVKQSFRKKRPATGWPKVAA